ncbi:exosome complex component RRP42-like [Tubulanus polymorphus]|uniref:exosome complex component RRP42-like n=1 Tax=Tubulanus polymorphus TaxID=672921 RepID=UPI003DA47508
MAKIILSETERTFVLHGVQDNFRCDGRSNEDYRHLEMETDVISNTTGSARVRLANTDILVGVKAELGEPLPERPEEGRIEFFTDCSANATPEFEGRGGEELAVEISNVLMRAYDTPASLDYKSLCVIPGQQCWVLYIDIVLLECGGNLFDVASLAVKAALFDTKIPNLTVTECDETGGIDIQLSDDPYDYTYIDIKQAPCLVTISKIGHNHIIDATLEEEACSLARLMVGVNEKGIITALKKEGSGSLNPDSLCDMIESGKKVGVNLNKTILNVLKQERNLNQKKVGFLGS